MDNYAPGHASAHCRKGRARRANEDRFSIHAPIPRQYVSENRWRQVQNEPAVYGVYDGHGGVRAAEYAMTAVPQLLSGPNREQLGMQRRLTTAFHAADADICSRCSQAPILGTTACVAVISSLGWESSEHGRGAAPTLHVAHVGDSRALLVSSGRNGGDSRFLTSDHTASRPDEMERIEAVGGYVLNNRVQGILAVSRALGDISLKQAVISTPDLVSVSLASHHRYLVLATDGIWSVCTDLDVCSVLDTTFGDLQDARLESRGFEPGGLRLASRALADLAVSRGSTDDISVIVVDLQAHRVGQFSGVK